MMYIAIVKDKATGQKSTIESDYPNKKAFAKDLRHNGYAVSLISTEENFDADCEKRSNKLEVQRIVSKLNRDAQKRLSNR